MTADPFTRAMQKSKLSPACNLRSGRPQAMILPSGEVVGIGYFVSEWKRLLDMPAGVEVTGWDWFPTKREWVLHKISIGVHDRINIRGGLRMDWKPMSSDKISRKLQETVVCECRWCGQRIADYKPKAQRFCGADCRRSYYN